MARTKKEASPQNDIRQWQGRFGIFTGSELAGKSPDQPAATPITTLDDLKLQARQAVLALPLAEQSTEYAQYVFACQSVSQLEEILKPLQLFRTELNSSRFFALIKALATWEFTWTNQLASAGEKSPARLLIFDALLLYNQDILQLWNSENELHHRQEEIWSHRVKSHPHSGESLRMAAERREWRKAAATLIRLCELIQQWDTQKTIGSFNR